jgi:hypothetical protein
MANRERGEFTLIAGEATYVLRLTTNACCELEDFSGRLFDDVQTRTNRGSLVNLRLLLWAALQEHHADIATPDKAGLTRVGRIIDAGGGLLGLMKQIRAFLAWNADTGDTPKKAGEAAAGARPPVARAGTGDSSTLMH